VIAAALDGIHRGLDPGDPVNEDPGNLTDAEREKRDIRRFPLTATEALDELERDDVLTGALGAGLATEYIKVRRAEAAAYGDKDEAFELDQHFFKY
jgi:glutamine synthetase